MGFAIKLSSGAGKRYEVACSDPVRGQEAIWYKNYDTTATDEGNDPEEYTNNVKLLSIDRNYAITRVASDGVSYSNVFDPHGKRIVKNVEQDINAFKRYELTRTSPKSGRTIPAYSIVFGYYTRYVWGSGTYYSSAYIDYTRSKMIRDSADEKYIQYPYIKLYNGRNAFSMKGTNTYNAVGPNDYVSFYDKITERKAPEYDTDLCYVDEVTTFFRKNKTNNSWVKLNPGDFNGSLFTCKGYKDNVAQPTFNRPYGNLSEHNIFYSYYTNVTSNNRSVSTIFTIFPVGDGAENRVVKNAPVIEMANVYTTPINFTSTGNSRPLLIFGIREKIVGDLS